MKPVTSFAVFALQAALHPCRVVKIECTANSSMAAGCFLQVHDSATTPAEGAVPVKSWPLTASAEQFKSFDVNELTLTAGCYVCVSTTEGTKTLGTSNNKFNMVSVELARLDAPESTSFAGDLTTGVATRIVWSEVSGPKRLIALEVDGTGLTTACYIQLFAKNTPSAGAKPIQQWPIAAGEVKTGTNALRFGNDGIVPYDKEADGTERIGCIIKISTTSGTLTLTSDTACIKAEYKA